MLSWNCAADGRVSVSCSRKTTVGMQSHSTCSHGSSRPSSLTLPRGTIASTSRHILHQMSFGHRPLVAPSLLLHGASTARRTARHSPRRASKATLACVRASTASSTAEPTSTPTSSSLSRTLVTAPFANSRAWCHTSTAARVACYSTAIMHQTHTLSSRPSYSPTAHRGTHGPCVSPSPWCTVTA